MFETDDQMQLARRYGEGVAFGQSLADIAGLAARVQAKTVDDIKRIANEYLLIERSVTGTLVEPQKAEANVVPQAVKQ